MVTLLTLFQSRKRIKLISHLYLLLIDAISGGFADGSTGFDCETRLDFCRGVAIPHSHADCLPPDPAEGYV
jgi:hypothetical protein